MDATKPYNMLIIDPQNDFHETFINENQIEQPGNLAVTGAKADSARIADFITNNREKINKIFVSLDTHTPNHIGHPGYWRTMDSTDETPVEPAPWTVFSVEGKNIFGTVYHPTNGNVISKFEYTPKRKPSELIDENGNTQYDKRVDFTKYYINTVPSKGKGPALIWPTHCLEGKPGHEVNAALRDALQQYDNSQGRLEYHIKGQNELVEMYSIFKAEIPMEDVFSNIKLDPPTKDNMKLYYTGNKPFKISSKINQRDTDREDGAYLQTSFNEGLFKSLTKDGNPIVICGEALSHCVNWSLRDLVTQLLERQTAGYYDTSRQKLMKEQVILLVNCSSRVQGMNDDFLKNVADLKVFCLTYGVTLSIVNNNVVIPINNDNSTEFEKAIQKYQEREAAKLAAAVEDQAAQGGTRKRRRHKNRRTKSKPKRSKKTHNRKPRHRRRTRK